ncbi:572_t:CDS:2, partial [Dentiscutata heterogama]
IWKTIITKRRQRWHQKKYKIKSNNDDIRKNKKLLRRFYKNREDVSERVREETLKGWISTARKIFIMDASENLTTDAVFMNLMKISNPTKPQKDGLCLRKGPKKIQINGKGCCVLKNISLEKPSLERLYSGEKPNIGYDCNDKIIEFGNIKTYQKNCKPKTNYRTSYPLVM